MGNDNSILHFTQQCSGLTGANGVLPFLPMVIWFWLFVGIIPRFFHSMNQRKSVATISECLREPGSIFSCIIFIMLVVIWYISICNRTSYLSIVEGGFIFLFSLVLAFNPVTSVKETKEYDPDDEKENKGKHTIFALLLFTYMYIISLWLTSTTYLHVGGGFFQGGIVVSVGLGIIYMGFVLIGCGFFKWGNTATLCEWIYCLMFSVQVLIIPPSLVSLDS